MQQRSVVFLNRDLVVMKNENIPMIEQIDAMNEAGQNNWVKLLVDYRWVDSCEYFRRLFLNCKRKWIHEYLIWKCPDSK